MARRSTQRSARYGRVCLFRLAGDAMPNDDETWVDDDNLIEMEGTARHPDGRTWYKSMNTKMTRIDTRNPAPFAENTPRPDTGFDGTRLTLEIEFSERTRVIGSATDAANRAAAIARLRDWHREDNSVRGRYRHGRIGIRNDYRPEFNLKPDNYGGYKLASFEMPHDLIVAYHIPATIILQYAGAPGQTERAGDVNDRLGNYTEMQG